MSESAAGRNNAAHEATEDWQLAHEELRRLARSRAGLDFEEGRWLLLAWRSGVHARLGYGSFREYVERLSDTGRGSCRTSCAWPRRSRLYQY
jgi:hypothetical protein